MPANPVYRAAFAAAVIICVATPFVLAQSPPADEAGQALPPAVERALEQYRSGDLAGAIVSLEAIRRASNPPGPALSLLGVLYLESDRPADALAVLEPLASREDADPAVLYHAGRAALALNRIEAGDRYLVRSAALAPRSEAARTLGIRRVRQGLTLAAYKHLLPWVAANPDDGQTRLAAAYCALDLERLEEARELLAGLPQEAPRVRLLRARLQMLTADLSGALALAEPLVTEHPPELAGEIHILTADLYERLGRPADAMRLLQGRPDLGTLGTLVLARARRARSEPAECERLLTPLATAARNGQLAERAALRTALLAEHGRCAVTLLHWPEAVVSLRAATALDASDVETWKLLATASRAAGDTAEAARAGQMVARPPGSVENPGPSVGDDAIDRNVAAAFAMARRGRIARALEALDVEAELAPSRDPRPQIARGVLLLQLGRSEDALRSAEAALARAPDAPEALHLRGAVLMGRRDVAGAERDLRGALARRQDFAPALGDLGVLLLQQNRAAEAVPFLERLAALQPQDEGVRRNLAEARRRSSGG